MNSSSGDIAQANQKPFIDTGWLLRGWEIDYRLTCRIW